MANQNNYIWRNDIYAVGGSSATGAWLGNHAGNGGSASQSNWLNGNTIFAQDLYGAASAVGVSFYNTIRTGSKGKYAFGTATQNNSMLYNSITAISNSVFA